MNEPISKAYNPSSLWYNNPYIVLAITSVICAVATFAGGLVIQSYLTAKIIPTMISYDPYSMFVIFFIFSSVIHLFGALVGFFRSKWFLSITLLLRFFSIMIGVATIYLNYASKDGLIGKVAEIWNSEEYDLTIECVKDLYKCCGWNKTTEECYYQRCYNSVLIAIDDISRMIGIGEFVINTFQAGLFVDGILMIVLHMVEDNQTILACKPGRKERIMKEKAKKEKEKMERKEMKKEMKEREKELKSKTKELQAKIKKKKKNHHHKKDDNKNKNSKTNKNDKAKDNGKKEKKRS